MGNSDVRRVLHQHEKGPQEAAETAVADDGKTKFQGGLSDTKHADGTGMSNKPKLAGDRAKWAGAWQQRRRGGGDMDALENVHHQDRERDRSSKPQQRVAHFRRH